MCELPASWANLICWVSLAWAVVELCEGAFFLNLFLITCEGGFFRLTRYLGLLGILVTSFDTLGQR